MKSLLPLPWLVGPHAKQKPVRKKKRNVKRTRMQKQQKASRRKNR